MDVDITGMEMLMRQVRALGNTKNLEKKALEAGAEHIKKEFESAAPVLSGKLKANILKSEIKGGSIDVGTSPTGDGFYGFFQEFGTSQQSARPWARPAWERNQSKVKNIMAEELRKGLNL